MAWEENPRICLHMQLIAILSRTGVDLARLQNIYRFEAKFNCEVGKSMTKC